MANNILILSLAMLFSIVPCSLWIMVTDRCVANKSMAKPGPIVAREVLAKPGPIAAREACHNEPPPKPSFDELKLWLQSLDIFLRERGHTDIEGYSAQHELQVQVYSRLFSTAKSVAEIGFNAGHSAMIMLAAGVEKVVEFDIGVHGYTKPAFEHIKSQFPQRSIEIYFGDSAQTVADYHVQNPNSTFDIVIVDGGHLHDQALQDIKNMAKLARNDTVLVVDDAPCVEFFCVTKAVEECEASGLITVTNRIALSQSRGFTLAKYNVNGVQ